MDCPVTLYPCNLKFISGRTSGLPVKIMLHATDLTLDQLSGQMQSPFASGFNPLLLPGSYPAHVSYHYGIDGRRIAKYVDTANTALGLGVGVTVDGFTDANSVQVAIATGQGLSLQVYQLAEDNYFTGWDLSGLAQELCCIFKDLGVAVATLTNLGLHSEVELPDINLQILIDLINECLSYVEPPDATLCDQLAALVSEDPGTATVGVTQILGLDCQPYILPSTTAELPAGVTMLSIRGAIIGYSYPVPA